MPRDVGSWTKNKLKILHDYLPVYLKATTRAIERVYIDGFAGPGLNRVRGTGEIIDGSPLIALGAQAENRTTFTRLFFIERHAESASELANIVAQRDNQRRCSVIQGDVNVELPRLIERLPRRSPTFVFLDPEGIDPRWTTLQKIAGWKTELLITSRSEWQLTATRTAQESQNTTEHRNGARSGNRRRLAERDACWISLKTG